ncbi:MAG TPA: hypothetical protein VNJ01_03450 [Bacteriovoracaceae bacterium]|nr:hypothetical protein [Bacteriovoracaceae bacterium]
MKYILLSSLFLSGCLGSKSSLMFEERLSKTPPPQTLEVSEFEALKTAVLVPHCIGCHAGMEEESKVKEFITAGSPDESVLFLMVKDGSMPKGKPPLNSEELEKVRLYIESLKVK